MKTPAIFLLFTLLMFSSCSSLKNTLLSPGEVSREHFLGTWTITEKPGNMAYQVTAVRDTASVDQIILHNIGHAKNATAYGIIRNNELEIPRQEFASGLYIEGEIIIERKGELTGRYTIEGAGDALEYLVLASL